MQAQMAQVYNRAALLLPCWVQRVVKSRKGFSLLWTFSPTTIDDYDFCDCHSEASFS